MSSIDTSAENSEIPHSNSAHHVKFNIQEEEFKNHHENLEINSLGPHAFNVNLGYLKVDHNYKVTFSLHLSNPQNPAQNYENIRYLADRSSKHVIFKEMRKESNNLYSFTVIFYAYREKHDQETIYFSLDDSNGHEHSSAHGSSAHHDHHNNTNTHNKLVIHFEAKVLGQHQGTPLLRNGITLLHSHSNSSSTSSFNDKSHFNIN